MYRENRDLYTRIQAFDLDAGPSARPFAARLAAENSWSEAYTLRVIEEYRRFVFLAATVEHRVSPSDAVDQAWHLHLTCSRSYWTYFCGEVLDRPLHHEPSRGGPEERARLAADYEDTLSSYQRVFEREPPADIWPAPEERRRDQARYQRVNLAHHWLVPKPRAPGLPARSALDASTGLLATAGLEALILAGSVAGSRWSTLNPFRQGDGAFLALYGASLAGIWWLGRGVRQQLSATDSVEASHSTLDLDPFEVAYLEGGPERASQAAIIGLAARGVLAIDATTRTITRRGDASFDLGPLERAVLRAIDPSAPPSIHAVCSATRTEARNLVSPLEQRGLLVRESQAKLARRLAGLPLFGLLAIGWIRLELSPSRLAGLLILGLIATFGLACMALVPRLRRTSRGDEALSRLRSEHRNVQRVGAENEVPDILFAVALFGVGALAGGSLDPLAKAFTPPVSDGVGVGCGGGCGGS